MSAKYLYVAYFRNDGLQSDCCLMSISPKQNVLLLLLTGTFHVMQSFLTHRKFVFSPGCVKCVLLCSSITQESCRTKSYVDKFKPCFDVQ